MDGSSIYRNELIGGPVQVGFMLLDVIDYSAGGNFVKADYPGLRAIRVNSGELVLAADLADTEVIASSSVVEAYC